jgi:tRNA pseudouridine38-40 synthase
VQSELDSALEKVCGEKVITVFAGRTDSGVHAMEQTVNFKCVSLKIPPERIKYPINALLPGDILVKSSSEVPENFHSRFSAKKRTYRYFIRRYPDLFKNRFSLIHPYDFDTAAANEAAKLFIGKKDFRSFCSTHSEVDNHFCSISELVFFRENDEVVMEISSDRFLQNMVRIIVSVFLELNKGKMKTEDIVGLFDKKDRTFSPKTISPKGLFLWKVEY